MKIQQNYHYQHYWCFFFFFFQFLDALKLSQSPVLLQLMTEVLCREQQHIMEDLFQSTFKNIARK